jgi:hypothetical protein
MKIMKTNRVHLLLAVLATLTANAAEPNPPAGKRPPPQPLQKALDTNRDGELSPDEISNSTAALEALDKNGDGALTRKELIPKPPKDKDDETAQGPPPPPAKAGKKNPPPPIIRALDLNKDGTLSAEEIDAAPESLLILDKNDDGTISRKELNPKPPKKEDT